jgi:hypothetical protein
MILGDHRQETEKKSKKEHTRLDWDINTNEDALHTNDDREDKAQLQLHPTDHT